MNERIRELWSQSENELDQDFASGKIPINIDRYWLDLMQEKFAELIVRECVEIAKDVNKNPYLDEHHHARQIIKNITKHFGVE